MVTETLQFVRYSDGVESASPQEAETIAGIIETMTQESRTVAERDGRTVRSSHAKASALLTGTLEVLPGLPPAYRQGLFSEPGRYDALVRLAQGPGEALSDSVSTHRGLSIKVLGVEGERLAGHGEATQDFVLATGPAFPQANSAKFLTAIKGVQKNTGLPEGLKQAVSSTARVANAALNAVGADSATLGFFGHTRRNPLADAYFSQAALRYGNFVAKIGVFPVSAELVAKIDETLDTGADPDAFRTATLAHIRLHGAVFELRVQLCTDLARMPVEDASVVWPEDESPYVTVARLTIVAQEGYSAARQKYFETLSFQPAHALAAHRPLGSLMRARLQTYQALTRYRHAQNQQAQPEPVAIGQVPD